jgi:catechol 2,3-dioxygenase-like lactoylglutathione lyase family enzyme
MQSDSPQAVPEIPVSTIDRAAGYYVNNLGFHLDWGGEEGGIAGISKGHCRMFLTNTAFREPYGTSGPVTIWLNLESKDQVDELHQQWARTKAKILSEPEDKPWNLREFTAADPDGNRFRVFYDFAWELREPAEAG